MGISIRNNIDKLIIAFAILILFSSDKNLLITHYLIGKKNISLMTISFIACLSLFLLFLISTRGSLILRRNHINILISSLFLALSNDAVINSKENLKNLVKESQTPKGLNEQAVQELTKAGFYKSIEKTLNSIHKRLNN